MTYLHITEKFYNSFIGVAISHGRLVESCQYIDLNITHEDTYTGATEVFGPGSVGRTGNGVSAHWAVNR